MQINDRKGNALTLRFLTGEMRIVFLGAEIVSVSGRPATDGGVTVRTSINDACARSEQRYSDLRALTTSTRAARRAGVSEATSAAATSTVAAAIVGSASGSRMPWT